MFAKIDRTADSGDIWTPKPAAHIPSNDPQQDPGKPRKPPPPQPADEPPPVPEGDPPSDAPPERAAAARTSIGLLRIR